MNHIFKVLRTDEFSPLRSGVFLTCFTMFVAHQVTQRILYTPIPFADNYLDSFVAMPILLTLLMVERRVLFRYDPNYRLSISEIILGTLLVAGVGELVFPAFSNEFTSDWWDVLAYSLGSLLFYTAALRHSNQHARVRRLVRSIKFLLLNRYCYAGAMICHGPESETFMLFFAIS